jgi:tetratricopeptide (TPR) repeat protein
LGTGHTQKIQKVKNYCQVEQLNEEKVKLTFLGNKGQPTGIVMEIAYDEFLKRYTLDPTYRVKTKDELERDRHIALAEKHRSRGEPYTAEMEYSSALKIDPESIRANFGIGALYMEMGDTSRAKDVFKKLSEIEAIFEEENKHIFNEFGIELRKANMIDEALANYQKAITISPEDEHLHFNVARLFYDKKDGDNALEWLQKSLAINPHFRDAQQFESLILKEMKEQGITPNARKANFEKASAPEKSSEAKENPPDADADKQISAAVKKSVPHQKPTIKQ